MNGKRKHFLLNPPSKKNVYSVDKQITLKIDNMVKTLLLDNKPYIARVA